MIPVRPSRDDVGEVTRRLGREPAGNFVVVVRDQLGYPVVIENEPHLTDGTPMPTLYWLIDPELHHAVSRLESDAGVHRYEELVDAEELRRTHERYADVRASRILRPSLVAPSGGVGGTRQGVKCLHAHLAYFLVRGEDPVGRLVADELGVDRERYVVSE